MADYERRTELGFPRAIPLSIKFIGGASDSFHENPSQAIAAVQVSPNDFQADFVYSRSAQQDLGPHVAYSQRDVEIGLGSDPKVVFFRPHAAA